MIKPNQILETKAISIRPIDQLPITIDFFNGSKYEADGIMYPGYTPVVTGTISKNQSDENYIDDETWEALVYDAFYDVDAYVNKAMTVLGMFHAQPNFSSIPIVTKDMMMRAIAAKIEQNLFTNPSNAEIRVTLTQNSGGRTTNLPARENFKPVDVLNLKVQEYINGSNIFELVADSFEAIKLDRNDYYTKDEINALIQSGRVPVEALYTLDVSGWEPTDPGDGVNKKYVDFNIDDLQSQINALLVGDVELVSNHIKLSLPVLESFTGYAEHQEGVNIENKIIIKKLREEVTNLNKRTGVPLQAYKTLAQTINSENFTVINDYDELGKGTQDSLLGMDTVSGEYTIQESSSGDQVSFSANLKVTGKVIPNTIVGYATFLRNGVEAIHPVSGLTLRAPIVINTLAGANVSVLATDINIREGVDGEWNIGDKISVAVSQTTNEVLAGNTLLISDVNFDMSNNRVLAEQGTGIYSSTVKVEDIEEESLSGLSTNQKEVNKENKTNISTLNTDVANLKVDKANQTDLDALATTVDVLSGVGNRKILLDNVTVGTDTVFLPEEILTDYEKIEVIINWDSVLFLSNTFSTLPFETRENKQIEHGTLEGRRFVYGWNNNEDIGSTSVRDLIDDGNSYSVTVIGYGKGPTATRKTKGDTYE